MALVHFSPWRRGKRPPANSEKLRGNSANLGVRLIVLPRPRQVRTNRPYTSMRENRKLLTPSSTAANAPSTARSVAISNDATPTSASRIPATP
jgi:hypothetical protein